MGTKKSKTKEEALQEIAEKEAEVKRLLEEAEQADGIDVLSDDEIDQALDAVEPSVTNYKDEYPTENHRYCGVKANTDPEIEEYAPPDNPTLILRRRIKPE